MVKDSVVVAPASFFVQRCSSSLHAQPPRVRIALAALAFVLAIGDPHRFPSSRRTGPYFGLTPRRHDSGDSAPQLRITKAGDPFVRRLLVGGAHYILGPFGPDCDLRRYGLILAARGGKNAKKRAVVAVARKLAVLMHKLWVSGIAYDPLFNATRIQAAA